MSNSSSNQAAWLKEKFANPIVVDVGPDQTSPADDEIIVKTAYAAINPVDWKVQDFIPIPVAYPHVFGSDVAGEVVAVGSKVTRFKKGDRVMGNTLGLAYGGPRHGAFQTYAALREIVTARIPDSISLADASVLPLALSTSFCGLFDKLQLRVPVAGQTPSSSSPDEVVLIWGASSSVGSVAIQLARHAGYTVFTTASKRNHEYARELSASQVFDYNDASIVDDIVKALQGKKIAGAFDCIAEGNTGNAVAQILSAVGGGRAATVLSPPENVPENVEFTKGFAAVEAGLTPGHIGGKLWQEYVPAALAKGELLPKPEPLIIKGGVGNIQEAMNLQKKGVSARKIVIEF